MMRATFKSRLFGKPSRVPVVLIALFCTCYSAHLSAQVQKQVKHYDQLWTGYFNQTRFSKKWGIWFDAQIRTRNNFLDSLSQVVVRPGITYYVDDNFRITGGYAYMLHYPYDNKVSVAQPEHRIWEQLQWGHENKGVRIRNQFRLEERWRRKYESSDKLGNGYLFNFRVRYNFSVQFSLTHGKFGKGSLTWLIGDEIMVNFGKQVVYNTFDQNRFVTGINYYISPNNMIHLGYINVFQQLPAGFKYRMVNGIRLIFQQNLDFRSHH